MFVGSFDQSSAEKRRLEEKQRAGRKVREQANVRGWLSNQDMELTLCAGRVGS
jgi:hypothetical protein